MAKKKAGKKAGKKKVVTKKTPPKRQRKGPRSQALPGMEQVRNAKLDAFCESIGDGRDSMNAIRGEEKATKSSALREMHDKGVEVYRHAGIDLVRVPGEEELLVRKSKAEASESGSADDAPASDPADPDADNGLRE